MNTSELLRQLGIESGHYDGMGCYREPAWDTLEQVLGSLGVQVKNPDQLELNMNSTDHFNNNA